MTLDEHVQESLKDPHFKEEYLKNTIQCEKCGTVDMSEYAQELRKVVYGAPYWLDPSKDTKVTLGRTSMTQEERQKAYESCPYHLLPNENMKHED